MGSYIPLKTAQRSLESFIETAKSNFDQVSSPRSSNVSSHSSQSHGYNPLFVGSSSGWKGKSRRYIQWLGAFTLIVIAMFFLRSFLPSALFFDPNEGIPIPRVSEYGEPFPDYLEKHFPLSRWTTGREDDRPILWLTISSSDFIKQGTAHMQHFIQHVLNRRNKRKTTLITFCMDELCDIACEEMGWFCFGGYREGKPEIIKTFTWPKLMGLIEILESGRDTFFVDSDVYFRSNPYEHMKPLGSFDFQIQEETAYQVNTGFFHIVSKPETVQLWRDVLDRDMQEVSRDQLNVNKLLNTFELRRRPDGGAHQDFISTTGLSVHVLPKEIFPAYHMAFNQDQSVFPKFCRTIIFHL
ncbi:hypothetical protein BT69DRAFT_1354898 [Atractiella rhizophila]|nr:hypothetical protein BT69DRAFT_1354898 [Atractiella rhizophila]